MYTNYGERLTKLRAKAARPPPRRASRAGSRRLATKLLVTLGIDSFVEAGSLSLAAVVREEGLLQQFNLERIVSIDVVEQFR